MTSTTIIKSADSTSRHRLSADFGLTKIQRIKWMLYNIANNVLPGTGVDSRMLQRNFHIEEAELARLWDSVTATASPARRLCDLFWLTLPWDRIAMDLPSARVIETGCGTGVYGHLLRRCLGERFENYLGVDIEANDKWETTAADEQFSFQVARAADTQQVLAGRNLIMTQSALEHFEEDLAYFQQVANFVSASTEPVLQVHLVPTASCIATFPWHGVREYTPRTLSKITRLFDEKTRIWLYALGGAQCNQVHRQYITWPSYRHKVDLRHTKNEEYQNALRAAIVADAQGEAHKPAFYALIFASNFAHDPFAS